MKHAEDPANKTKNKHCCWDCLICGNSTKFGLRCLVKKHVFVMHPQCEGATSAGCGCTLCSASCHEGELLLFESYWFKVHCYAFTVRITRFVVFIVCFTSSVYPIMLLFWSDLHRLRCDAPLKSSCNVDLNLFGVFLLLKLFVCPSVCRVDFTVVHITAPSQPLTLSAPPYF